MFFFEAEDIMPDNGIVERFDKTVLEGARVELGGEHLADRMFVAEAEVARPALCGERGLRRIGRCRASRIGGRAMQQDSAAFVGLDTSKRKISVALAEGGRHGEVRFLGDVDHTPEAVQRLVTKLAGKFGRLLFCYEAGPTGHALPSLTSTPP